MTRPLLVYPCPPPPELAQSLDLAGYQWKAVGEANEVTTQAPDDGWGAAVVCADDDPTGAFSVTRSVRRVDSTLSVLVLLGGAQLVELEHRDELFDDFCLTPFHPRELEARLSHLLASSGTEVAPDLIEHGELVLNLETYQAAISGNALDLTYMEYELLKFLASNPGKVFTRETLLSRVWGYDYYGGARTVDVHVRRLRSKLGEEHAAYIHTVRSVGYRFGQSRWTGSPPQSYTLDCSAAPFRCRATAPPAPARSCGKKVDAPGRRPTGVSPALGASWSVSKSTYIDSGGSTVFLDANTRPSDQGPAGESLFIRWFRVSPSSPGVPVELSRRSDRTLPGRHLRAPREAFRSWSPALRLTTKGLQFLPPRSSSGDRPIGCPSGDLDRWFEKVRRLSRLSPPGSRGFAHKVGLSTTFLR